MDTAWAFFSNPRNLPDITPPDMGFEITNVPEPKTYAGQIITYRVRPLAGIAMNWVTEITQCQPPHFFIDEQRFGPYRFWHHQHRFIEFDGQTTCIDEIHYGLPLDVPFQLVHRLLVRPRLEQIFAFRRDALQRRWPGTQD